MWADDLLSWTSTAAPSRLENSLILNTPGFIGWNFFFFNTLQECKRTNEIPYKGNSQCTRIHHGHQCPVHHISVAQRVQICVKQKIFKWLYWIRFFFFCTLQRSAGCNDMLDVRSALSGLEKTGIVAASHANNVQGSFVSTGNIIRSSEHVAKLFCSLSAALAAWTVQLF